MERLRLFWVDFDTATCMEEDALYILKAKEFPSKEEARKALDKKLYCGTIYVNDIKEVTEADIRSKAIVLIEELKEKC